MAPSAAAVEIRDIFDEIISNNLQYCALCLRTENERRLVEPKSFMKCLCIMRLGVPVVNTICYVCEAAASRAVALFQAISFSCMINRWFKDMSTKLKYKEGMPDHLDRYVESTRARESAPPGLGAPPLGRAWRQARAHLDLVQTEVLLVSDAQPNAADRHVVEMTTSPCEASPAQEAAAGASLETPPPPDLPEPYPLSAKDPNIQNVVIIEDDDDDPPRGEDGVEGLDGEEVGGQPKLVPLEQLMELPGAVGSEQLVPSSDKDVSKFILHPLMASADGAVYAPTLAARLLRARLLPPRAHPPGVTVTTMEVINEGELIPCSESDPLSNTQGVPDPLGDAPGVSVLLADSPGVSELLGDSPGMSELLSDPPSESDPLGESQGVPDPLPDSCAASAPAARRLSGGRIDWEDKIPMDVISFVDATDPLAEQLLRPKRRRARAPDVIDLC